MSTDQAYWQVVSLVNKKKLAEGYLKLLQQLDSDVEGGNRNRSTACTMYCDAVAAAGGGLQHDIPDYWTLVDCNFSFGCTAGHLLFAPDIFVACAFWFGRNSDYTTMR